MEEPTKILLAEHCRHCEHQVVDFSSGTYCGLTNRKPAFIGNCPKIKFGSKLLKNVESANVNLKILEARKLGVLYKFWSQIIVGIVVVGAGIYLVSLGLFIGIYTGLPYIVISAGFAAFPIGFYAYTKYRSEFRAARSKKELLHNVLALNEVTYDITIDLGKEIHGEFIPKVSTRFHQFNLPLTLNYSHEQEV